MEIKEIKKESPLRQTAQASPDCKRLLEATKAVFATGLNVYALIGKYKRVCGVARLEEQTIIDACESFMKYREGIKGKAWPYFIRVLHTKHQTFKPQSVRVAGAGPMSINEILKSMGVA